MKRNLRNAKRFEALTEISSEVADPHLERLQRVLKVGAQSGRDEIVEPMGVLRRYRSGVCAGSPGLLEVVEPGDLLLDFEAEVAPCRVDDCGQRLRLISSDGAHLCLQRAP